MPKYRFNVNEQNYGYIEVEAENKEQASQLAQEKYDEGNTTWGDTKIEITLSPNL